jgi:hypothetical protein
MQTERPMSRVKSRGLLERGNEKQEVVGKLCLIVSSGEAKPDTSLKWITFLETSIIIKQTHINDLTIRKHVKYDKNSKAFTTCPGVTTPNSLYRLTENF